MTDGNPAAWEVLLEALSLDLSAEFTPYLGLAQQPVTALRGCSRVFLADIKTVPQVVVNQYVQAAGGRDHPYERQLAELIECVLSLSPDFTENTLWQWLQRGLGPGIALAPWFSILAWLAGEQPPLVQAPVSAHERSALVGALSDFYTQNRAVDELSEHLSPTTRWDRDMMATSAGGSPLNVLNNLASDNLFDILVAQIRAALSTDDWPLFLRWAASQHPHKRHAETDISTFPQPGPMGRRPE